jgi:hypothetical protein
LFQLTTYVMPICPTKAAAATLDRLLDSNGLLAVDIKNYIDPKVVPDARRCAKQGRVLSAARLATLQAGLAKLQAEGVLKGLKAAKTQQVQADSQRKADTQAAATALNDLMTAHGLLATDVKGYIDSQVVYSATTQSRPPTRLRELQEGLAKLQAEGVLEAIKAAKAARAIKELQRLTATQAAIATLRDLMKANGLVPVDIAAYINSQLVHHARQCEGPECSGLPAEKLERLQAGLAKLQAEGVVEGIKTAKAQHEQAESQCQADFLVAAATMRSLMSAHGLGPADIKGYIPHQLVRDLVRQCESSVGPGLSAARLKKLQEGLAKLQVEGVLEGIKAAKACEVRRAATRAKRKLDTEEAAKAVKDLLRANGLVPADAKGHIDTQLLWGQMPARLEELQEGLAKLQAEGVVEGIKAANAQQELADVQYKADTVKAAAALDDLLRCNGLLPADTKGYMDSKMVPVWGWGGKTSSKLEKLRAGLAKLQAEGVVEGIKAAKAEALARQELARERRSYPSTAPSAKRRRQAGACVRQAGTAEAGPGPGPAAAAPAGALGVGGAAPGCPQFAPGLPALLPRALPMPVPPGLAAPMTLSVEQLRRVAPALSVEHLQQMVTDATNKTKRMMMEATKEAAGKAAAAAGGGGASGPGEPPAPRHKEAAAAAAANGEAPHTSESERAPAEEE